MKNFINTRDGLYICWIDRSEHLCPHAKQIRARAIKALERYCTLDCAWLDTDILGYRYKLLAAGVAFLRDHSDDAFWTYKGCVKDWEGWWVDFFVDRGLI